MGQERTILIVDDDIKASCLLKEFFQQHDFLAYCVASGDEMFTLLKEKHIDLVILDLILKNEDGLVICKELRAISKVPILLLTAVNSDCERILGLEYGADDYVTKPFSHRVLLARTNAILRRVYPHKNEIKIYRFADWELDTNTRELTDLSGKHIKLTTGLYELLSVFLESSQRILTRDQLLDVTQGRPGGPFDRSVDIQLSRLRNKLNDNGKNSRLIKTVRNEGYILSAAVTRLT